MPAASPMPTVENSTGDSPKELIAAYLNKQGMPLTNANYALALKANSDTPGTIPGLVNMEPITSEGDPGFIGPSKPRGGGARPIPGPPPVPPGPPGSQRTGETVTTTPPEGMSLADIVALMLGGGAAGAANWLKPKPAVPDGGLSRPPVEGQRALPAPEPQARIAGPEPQLRIAGPQPGAPGGGAGAPVPAPTPPPAPSPSETAMQRALAPPNPVDGVSPVTPPPNYVEGVDAMPERSTWQRFRDNIGIGRPSGPTGKVMPKIRPKL